MALTRAQFYGVSKARLAKLSMRQMLRIRKEVEKLAVLWGDVDEAVVTSMDRALADGEEQIAASIAALDEVMDDL